MSTLLIVAPKNCVTPQWEFVEDRDDDWSASSVEYSQYKEHDQGWDDEDFWANGINTYLGIVTEAGRTTKYNELLVFELMNYNETRF